MAQPTALEAGFPKAAHQSRRASLAIGAVAVVNGAAPDRRLLKSRLVERIRVIPRSMQVLTSAWNDDPRFDLAHHLHRVTLPGPGGDAELFRAISHALERPLNLDRPPWECWIIEGLKDNQWAMLMKIHHRMADGVSPAQILSGLCDDADNDMIANNIAAEHISSTRSGPPGWADVVRQASTVVGAVTSAVAGAILPTPRTLPAGRPSAPRRYGTVRVPITDVDGVCRKFGVTANDVAVAAISEGFRTVLLHGGEQPRADSLPIAGTREKPALPYLPVEHDDPVQRLRTVHTQLNHAKRTGLSVGGISDFPPFALCAKAIQLLTRLPQRSIVMLATHAPGPRHPLRLLDQPIRSLLPIPPTALQLSTGVSVLSYGDDLIFGITADGGPELERLAAGIELGVARLVALSQDSVLLFTKDRRKRSARALANGAQRRRPSASSVRARR